MNKKRISALTLTAMLSGSILHSEEVMPLITEYSEEYVLPSLESATAEAASPETPAQDTDIIAPPAEPETPPAAEEPATPAPEEEGTPVGHAAKSGSRDARNRTWQNVGLAVATVAVAVTAIILVSSNSGHRHR